MLDMRTVSNDKTSMLKSKVQIKIESGGAKPADSLFKRVSKIEVFIYHKDDKFPDEDYIIISALWMLGLKS